LSVGVGALAGSTIMLLTVPWFLSIVGGRVNIVDGLASYKQPKLTPSNSLSFWGTGVNVGKLTNKGAYIMIFTSLTYFFLQIPAIALSGKSEQDVAAGENLWSLIGFSLCTLFFFWYLFYQYQIKDLDMENGSLQKELIEEKIREAIEKEQITLLGVMSEYLKTLPPSATSYSRSEYSPLVPPDTLSMLKNVCYPFFKKYDIDGNGALDVREIGACFKDLGEKVSGKELQAIFRKMERRGQGNLMYDEFVEGVTEYLLNNQKLMNREATHNLQYQKAVNDGDDDGEEEEMPEDLSSLSPEDQQKRIIMRSMWMLGLGTAIVLLISDPMVGVLSEIGKRTGVQQYLHTLYLYLYIK